PTSPCAERGTLKSTRKKTRRPASVPPAKRSSSVSSSVIRILSSSRSSVPPEERQQVHQPVGVSPLVVVPGDDADETAVHRLDERQIDDRRARIAHEVRGDQLFVGRRQDAAHPAGGGGAEGGAHIVGGGGTPEV